MKLAVSAFYKFTGLVDCAALRDTIEAALAERGIKGTVLLAPEGINGTIAGEAAMLADAMRFLRGLAPFADLESKESFAVEMPFQRLKVRLKKEIVTLGVAGVDPTAEVGAYVAPEDWNALISDPGVLVIDTRNHFEVAAGTFAGAVDPMTDSFGQFPDYVRRELAGAKDRRIAMFCTGGIRCEKATSFMLKEGFAQVYHLKGGILKYLETVRPGESLWRGSCFVFDERAGLGHGLEIQPATAVTPARPDGGGNMNGS
jgi:UPF0176 protein